MNAMSRSKSILAEIKCDLFEIQFTKLEKLDLSKIQQLPTYKYVIERYLTISTGLQQNLRKKQDTVLTELTKELIEIWVFMNIPPKTFTNVKNDIKALVLNFNKLTWTHESKRKETWRSNMMSLIKILEHGFDIKEKISRSANEYIQMYGVAPGSDEDLLYEDNCCNGCPRKVWCAGVDTAWWTEAKKRFAKIKRKSETSEKSGQRREEDRRYLKSIRRMQEAWWTPLSCRYTQVELNEKQIQLEASLHEKDNCSADTL